MQPTENDVRSSGRLASYDLGEFTLESGEILQNARIVYAVHGRLNEQRNNIIVYPTFFLGTHAENAWLIGGQRALDPSQYCIVVPNLLGNGVSTSPSNTVPEQQGAKFPLITFGDQVRAQHQLVADIFQAEKVAAVVGWSIGACQAFHWAVAFPNMVQRLFPFCGSARTSEHNAVFLESVEHAIRADPDLELHGTADAGLRVAARIYAGWGFSQPFFRDRRYQQLGFTSREDFVTGFWEAMMLSRNPFDVLSMLATWKGGDVGSTAHVSTEEALKLVTAKTTVIAAARDLYFTAEDSTEDASRIPGAAFVTIPGIWGHSAGAGLNEEDNLVIDAHLRELLAS